MSIHDLLANFDADDIRVQFLSECITDITATKRGSRVTFCTAELTPHGVATDSGPTGIVLWIQRDKWTAFQAGLKQKGAS